jgi:flagellin-specific chaperone FliS
LSAEQALELKEYLIKIYTWTLNRKNIATLSTQIELEDLKNVVVKKLCEAYMNTP